MPILGWFWPLLVIFASYFGDLQYDSKRELRMRTHRLPPESRHPRYISNLCVQHGKSYPQGPFFGWFLPIVVIFCLFLALCGYFCLFGGICRLLLVQFAYFWRFLLFLMISAYFAVICAYFGDFCLFWWFWGWFLPILVIYNTTLSANYVWERTGCLQTPTLYLQSVCSTRKILSTRAISGVIFAYRGDFLPLFAAFWLFLPICGDIWAIFW